MLKNLAEMQPYELTQTEIDTIEFLQSICQEGSEVKTGKYALDLMRIAYYTGRCHAHEDVQKLV